MIREVVFNLGCTEGKHEIILDDIYVIYELPGRVWLGVPPSSRVPPTWGQQHGNLAPSWSIISPPLFGPNILLGEERGIAYATG